MDREIRLRSIWIDLKRKNAIGGIDAQTFDEMSELNTDVVDLVRRVRWRVDQELTRHNVTPLFPNNYAGKYDKEEFLIDVDLEFYKIKKLLERSPNVLKEDPVLAVDYLKIIQLIRRKKLLEFSGNHFDPANQYYTKWLDKSIIERKEKLEEIAEVQKFEE